jgi:hypothetical protein
MTDQKEQQKMFGDELEALVSRCREEYELTYESMIGGLRLCTAKLEHEAIFEEELEDNNN